ncbi:hypothetical protein ERO13_D08G109908v2 [Gossypium hirsutum]|uniref:PH domain-containing protein n=1 Tax=Gossypium tomentosum TaxID=34277 RepID=A0A5D2JTW3_GOSTO|nr:hypothetical protein ERO13_D08G109908v2 [Gossypium hirsutum]TYH57996.1 hypothetical protein ES332_D08G126000v1 [Gossypium tomentosum]
MAHQSFRDNRFHKKHSSDLLMRIQVYSSALKLVRSMLHLPHLKEGNMTAPPVENAIALHHHYHNKFQDVMHARQNQCKLLCRVGSVYYWFMLVIKAEQKQVSRSLSGTIAEVTNEENSAIRVEIPDIVSVSSCADLTLPPGAGLCIDTTHGPIFLIADSWESLNGWLDAIRLVYTIYARGKTDVLASIITS